MRYLILTMCLIALSCNSNKSSTQNNQNSHSHDGQSSHSYTDYFGSYTLTDTTYGTKTELPLMEPTCI